MKEELTAEKEKSGECAFQGEIEEKLHMERVENEQLESWNRTRGDVCQRSEGRRRFQ